VRSTSSFRFEHTPAILIEITHLIATPRTGELSTESVRKSVYN
jgi:hypothetical protein